ncbi:DNA polymerase subunit gamma-1-like isoform X2 [Littorina saxatilis]|uniref:DNA polymerase subunit gamma-1 n=1 Tax=Littorina saxatilis TaxID=31220 RepID=A0AAN9GHH9_9CAEN
MISRPHLWRKLSASNSLTWCQRCWLRSCLHPHQQRFNTLNIQMLADVLHKQVFPSQNVPHTVHQPPLSVSSSVEKEDKDLPNIQAHLQKFDLLKGKSQSIPDVDLNLPKLFGQSVDEHFRHIASEQIRDYKAMAESIAKSSPPPFPKEWACQKGWTKYKEDGSSQSVPFPDDDVVVFDIECLMQEGNFPTMATALSPNHWYSWTADCVLQDKLRWAAEPQLSDLIPMETKRNSTALASKKRLIIGHNVGFDRSFVKEQYLIQGSKTRFLDTMSMHIAVCGLTSFQRILYQSSIKESSRKEVREHSERQKLFNMAASEEWKKVSGMNNLNAVYQLHCKGEPLKKETRDVFIKGTMADVRNDFQNLMTYCANDVLATHAVFAKLWPEFLERFPHPVTLGGMLEMGTAYLPVDSRWPRYIEQANATYDECQRELRKLLVSLADEACHLVDDDAYKDDLWLWDLDWTVASFKMNRSPSSRPKAAVSDSESIGRANAKMDEEENLDLLAFLESEEEREERRQIVERVYATASRLPKNPTFMAGYPAWYRELCPRLHEDDWYPGPSNISTQCRVTPKLMRLTWDGYPLHFDSAFGWGYLVPSVQEPTELELELDRQDTEEEVAESKFPVKAFMAFMKKSKPELFQGKQTTGTKDKKGSAADSAHYLGTHFDRQAIEPQEAILHWDASKPGPKKKKSNPNLGDGPHDIGLPGCLFYGIPHKDGSKKRVGNPLAKDYLHRVEDGTLRAETGDHANRALLLSKLCSYWKNNQMRIEGQMVSWMKKAELPKYVTKQQDFEEYGQYGAIVPRIAVAGTITRRAVEPTWLTASNAYPDRIGSELKAMVHTPPGYHFVGADVDSQELWIAAILGDAHFKKIHGCTALGWMTLQGNKADKTDLHSKTAELAKVSRDHAKVLNYGRIYGAGQAFAEQLLMQFNPSTAPHQARTTARDMFKKTKGERNREGQWTGGSESFMFNALEKIANSEKPTTPVLGCRISKALEPRYVLDDFLTSRVNWVVQSSAVDYLHLMLVSMRWLIDTYNIQARFCISIHDEVRYLVTSPDRYRTALALHITNLLTRAIFAERLGMADLPQSVAFFSAVDVDTCLRKEVNLDCRTPSNPHGLAQGYSTPQGEALNIHEVIKRTGGKLTKAKKT